MMTAGETSEQPFTLGTRQVALVGFVIVTMLALVTTISYSAGRIAKPNVPPARTAAAFVRSAPVVDRVVTPVVAAVAAPVVAPVVAVIPPPVAAPPALTAKPAAGSLFLQVAAVDRGMAEVSVEYLGRKGFMARLAPSPTEGTFRVLVGPLAEGAETARIKEQLEGAGFRPFVQRY